MEEVPILGRDDHRGIVKEFMAQYAAPAYVRRARRVEEALEQVLGRCRQQREEWLGMVRLCLGRLRALAGTWDRLRPWLADENQADTLERLHAELAPQLRLPLGPTRSPRVLRRALAELTASLEHFNRRWQVFLRGVDLAEVNTQREQYNRYYLLEKECAVRSPRLARQGYRPLEPFTVDDLAATLPPLPVPVSKAETR